MFSVPRSVLFDDEPSEEQNFVEDPVAAPIVHQENFYNLKRLNWFMTAYMIFLITQYACAFMSVPFDEIVGRPAICVVSSCYDVFTFFLCCSSFPMSTAAPSAHSVKSFLVAFFLQVIGLCISIPSAIAALGVEEIYSYEYDSVKSESTKIDVTVYCQVMACVVLAVHTITVSLCAISAWLGYEAFSNLTNRTNKRSQVIEFETLTEAYKDIEQQV